MTLSVQPAIAIFDTARGEACGVAPVGVADPTFFAPITKTQREAGGVRALATNDAGEMVDALGNVGGIPVGSIIDPITGGLAYQIGSKNRFAENAKRWNKDPFKVMASPPTITIATSLLVAGGMPADYSGDQFYAAPSSASNKIASPVSFSLFGAGNFDQLGTIANDYNFISAYNISKGTPSAYGTGFPRVSFRTSGSRFIFVAKMNSQKFAIKINGEWVSLTPTTMTTGSPSTRYVLVEGIGTDGVDKRVDIIFDNSFAFGGIYIPQTAHIAPVQRTGPRMVVIGDSFTEGAGDEVATFFGWVGVLQEYIGWDDVISSGVGSTGLLQTAASRVKYRDRIQHDLIDLAPQKAWISMSVNDNAFTAAEVVAEAEALGNMIAAALPATEIIFSSPTINKGAGNVVGNSYAQSAAVKALCVSKGWTFVDDTEMPFQSSVTPQTTALTADVAADATSIQTADSLLVGAHYKLGGNTHFFVKSKSGLTATVDKVNAAFTSGATVTQVGACYLTGNGKVGGATGSGNCDVLVSSDGTHPTHRGHLVKGSIDAGIYAQI